MFSERENFTRNVKLEGPDRIPFSVHINNASWDAYRHDMEKVCLKFPQIFPSVKKGWRDYKNFDFSLAYDVNNKFTDSWGSIWETCQNGIEGVVTNAILDDWSKLDDYIVPDANTTWDRGPADWQGVYDGVKKDHNMGRPAVAGPPHGFIFLRATYLRGFENAMIDFATDDARMHRLIDMLVEHNMVLVEKFIDAGVDMVMFADDLGSQESSILSPATFNKFIRPAYEKLMKPCHDNGILVGLHSDGNTLDILEEQVRAGVDMVNPQDLCNGIDNIARIIKGRACVNLDIDRQSVIPYGTAEDIDDLIKEEVMKLGSQEGGLSFIAGIYPPTPPENVEALCNSLLKYQRYWWE